MNTSGAELTLDDKRTRERSFSRLLADIGYAGVVFLTGTERCCLRPGEASVPIRPMDRFPTGSEAVDIVVSALLAGVPELTLQDVCELDKAEMYIGAEPDMKPPALPYYARVPVVQLVNVASARPMCLWSVRQTAGLLQVRIAVDTDEQASAPYLTIKNVRRLLGILK